MMSSVHRDPSIVASIKEPCCGGSPTSLDFAKHAAKLIALGLPKKEIREIFGISESTLRRWLAKAKEAKT